jgi:hypothetical protein
MLRFLASAVLFCSTTLADDRDAKSLEGLPPVWVDITVVAPTSVGIGEADLKVAVESRLRSGGINIATPSGSREAFLAPHLFIRVTAPVALPRELDSTGRMGMYLIGVSLVQYVMPYRSNPSTAPQLFLQTWQKDLENVAANGNTLRVSTRELAEKIIDEFIADFRKANPKTDIK